MAKKNDKNSERRAMVEQMRQQQARKERNRSMLILGVCIVAVVGLLAAALIPYLNDRKEDTELAGTSTEKLGVSASAAACDPIETKPTDKNQNHIPNGQQITYGDAPPAFGEHRPQAAGFGRPFYTPEDRPELGELVHNGEHGYTILWYDDTVADDDEQLKVIKALATKYQDANVRFVAAPWTSNDGEDFPEGKHIALTRWSADAENPSDQEKQRGNWQYCGSTSGAVVADFVKKWPNEQSPEPNVM